MMNQSVRSLSLLLSTSVLLTVFNGINLSDPPQHLSTHLRLDQPVLAKSKSGGRSGGGSFNKGSSGSRSSSRGSSSSRSKPAPSSSYNHRSYDHRPSYHRSSGVYYGRSSPVFGWLFLLILLGMGGLVLFLIVYYLLKKASDNHSNGHESQTETILNNDIFTLSKVQIALGSDAKDIQTTLSEITLNTDTTTPEGLQSLYHEVILTLLRHQEDWTHVSSTSQKVTLENAEALFSEFSLEERAKFQTETLSNIQGKIKQWELGLSNNNDSAYYIVVTLIIGTAHDRPLFGQIRQKDELKQVLKNLAVIPQDYLLKFEVIWTPQTPEDTLSYDDFLLEYTDMLNLS